MARTYGTKSTPTNAAELAEALADPAEAARLFGGDVADWQSFHAKFAAAAGAADPGIDRQVSEQVQQEIANWLRKEGGAGVPVNLSPGSASARNALHSKRAVGVSCDGIFDSLGEMVQALHPKADPANGKLAQFRNAMSSNTPSGGGFLVPEEFRSDLLSVALERAVVRPRATVVPMSSATLAIPMTDDTSHTSSVFGGIVGAWTEESATMDVTEPEFGRAKLEAKKLTAYSEVPNELVADVPGFDAIIAKTFPAAVAWYEDQAFMRGTGVGEPLGFLKAPAGVVAAKETGQAADTIVWENILTMVQRLLPSSFQNAIWIANVNCFKELATMGLAVGTGGGPTLVSNFAQPAPTAILGRPVIFTEHAPSLGDEGDVTLVDLDYYLIGDRQAMSIETSQDYKFRTDELAIRLIERADGRLWLQSPITPAFGSDTLSPVVKLAARA